MQLSVDDFGTSYSSLGYLKRFPLDELKIDRDFIRDTISNADDAAIALLTIINLAHSPKLRMVVEGMETEGQLNFLRQHGCDELQGYYLPHPQLPAACTRMLTENKRLALPQHKAAKSAVTLLLVEHEEELRRLSQAFLTEDFNVLTAKNASEGFEILARHHVDIVIIDNDLPSMSGIEFLTRVCKLYASALRVLASVGDDIPTLTRATIRAGIHLFPPKRWAPERLCAEVRSTLEMYANAAVISGQHQLL